MPNARRPFVMLFDCPGKLQLPLHLTPSDVTARTRFEMVPSEGHVPGLVPGDNMRRTELPTSLDDISSASDCEVTEMYKRTVKRGEYFN